MTSSARLIALPIVSAGIIGGAALGLAGMANATPTVGGHEATGPGYSYGPHTFAKPAPTQQPGWHAHHGPQHIGHLTQR
jgi:hypothetical protein